MWWRWMKGIIWYKEKQKGLERLDRLIEDYAKINIGVLTIRDNQLDTYIHFLNDDVWFLVPATDRSRGRACNVSLIDSRIDKHIINTIIMPTVKANPYRAYNFY